MKVISRVLPFTEKTEWAWPDEDEKLVQVFEHVSDIDLMMSYVKKPRICIQAGGACGVWPLRFSMFFEKVVTAEPMPENYTCLLENTAGITNIESINAALSNKHETGSMVFDRTEHNNYGAVYFQPGEGGTRTIEIDDLALNYCDLIQLDIEGYELEALQGAEETIKKHSPIIVLEEKQLPQLTRDYKAPRAFLSTLGYIEVDRIHKDVIFEKC